MRGWIAMILAALALAGCASLDKTSPNYFEKGMVVDKLQGHAYYYALGKVGVYLAGTVPIRSQDTAVALLVDDQTGRILRIVTLQPAGRSTYRANSESTVSGDISAQVSSTTYVQGDMTYKISDLIGGIEAVEIRPTGSWAEALDYVNRYGARL